MFTESYYGPAATVLAPKPIASGPTVRSQFRSASSGYHHHRHARKPSTSSLDIYCNVSTAQAYTLLSSSTADDHHHHGPEGMLISSFRAALTNMEYNRATQRLTGSIAVRDLSDSGAPVEVAVQYSVDGGRQWAETAAHLLFVHADLQYMQQQCTNLDVYGFTLRAGRNTIAQPGQTMHLRVVVRDVNSNGDHAAREMLFVDDNRGAFYECRGVAFSPRSPKGDDTFVLRL